MNNEEKLNSIYMKYRENKNSHVYLVETNSIDLALEDIKKLIIKINSYNEINNIENLVVTNSLPTLTIIKPENQEITKDSIEDLIKKIQKIPVITKENYFIICDAEKLNQKSGNIMLKIIEEPESDILGFFICNNENKVLKTIQSRTQYISLKYDVIVNYDQEIISDAQKYLNVIHTGQGIEMNKYIVDKYKDINNVLTFLSYLIELEKKYIDTQVSFDIINNENEILKKLYNLDSNIRINGNINLLFDKFLIEVSRLK